VKLLRKELRAIVSLDGPAEVLHFRDAARGFEFERAIVGMSSLHLVADRLGEAKESVVLPPEIAFVPFTRNRVNPPAVLHRAGAKIAFVPSPATLEGIEAYPFRVGEVVKAGLPRDVALRAMTLTPAEILGVADRVGSIAEGKDANVLFFDRDPFDPAARLRRVLLEGKFVEAEE
jgi:imidazolonepropionase-like amidohydrolase